MSHNSKLVLPDVVLRGKDTTDSRKFLIKMQASCYNWRPVGYIKGLLSEHGKPKIYIESNTPVKLAKSKIFSTDHVCAIYKNATVKNLATNKKFTNSTIFISATTWTENSFNATIKIYNNGKLIFKWAGNFTDDLIVYREGFCKLKYK